MHPGIIVAVILLIFCLGALLGNGLNSLASEHRSRRQAQMQRRLVDEWCKLEAIRLDIDNRVNTNATDTSARKENP